MQGRVPGTPELCRAVTARGVLGVHPKNAVLVAVKGNRLAMRLEIAARRAENLRSDTVSVIATATNTVTATIPVGTYPYGVAVTPDGGKVYVANFGSNNVSVIATATNTVIGSPIPIGTNPAGVAVTPDGGKVYVANSGSNNVSVIATATNTVTATIPVGNNPIAFGVFIQPVKSFAGTPGKANCYGQSVSALARQYGGLNAAAAALGFSSITALEKAILAFCEQ
jgi:YVTN family beta-propeller protein